MLKHLAGLWDVGCRVLEVIGKRNRRIKKTPLCWNGLEQSRDSRFQDVIFRPSLIGQRIPRLFFHEASSVALQRHSLQERVGTLSQPTRTRQIQSSKPAALHDATRVTSGIGESNVGKHEETDINQANFVPYPVTVQDTTREKTIIAAQSISWNTRRESMLLHIVRALEAAVESVVSSKP